MVLYHEEYIVKAEPKKFKREIEQNAKLKDQSKLARIVAGHLVEYFGWNLSVNTDEDYLFKVDWLEPGPRIELGNVFSAFEGTALLGDSGMSVKDIIRVWGAKGKGAVDSISGEKEKESQLDSTETGKDRRRSKRKRQEE